MTTSLTAIGLFVATLYAFQNLLRYARAADWNGFLGILVAVGTGVATVALAAHADVTSGLHLMQQGNVLGPALGVLDGASQVMLGVAVGSSGTVLADLKNAFDNSTSAAKPKLVPVASEPIAA